jgi:hypothetical protein
VLDFTFALWRFFCFCADLRLGSDEVSGSRHGPGELLSSLPSVFSGFVIHRASDREEVLVSAELLDFR